MSDAGDFLFRGPRRVGISLRSVRHESIRLSIRALVGPVLHNAPAVASLVAGQSQHISTGRERRSACPRRTAAKLNRIHAAVKTQQPPSQPVEACGTAPSSPQRLLVHPIGGHRHTDLTVGALGHIIGLLDVEA